MEYDENSSESESTSQSATSGKRKAATNKGGRPRASIWEDFNELSSDGKGHYGVKCQYCKKSWKRGKPTTMEAHLALHCKGKVPESIKMKWLIEIAKRGERAALQDKDEDTSSKPGSKRQKTIKDHYKSNDPISDERQAQINQILLRAFICCGIPWAVIDNPFFRDLLTALEPGYIPPSRKTLSERILNEEAAKIDIRTQNHLKKAENLTLSMYKNIITCIFQIVHNV